MKHAQGLVAEQLGYLARLGLFAPVVLGLSEPLVDGAQLEALLSCLAGVGLEPNCHEASEFGLDEILKHELDSGKSPVVVFRSGTQTQAQRFSQLAAWVAVCRSQKLVRLRLRGGLLVEDWERCQGSWQAASGVWRDGVSVVNLRTDAELLLSDGVMAPGEQAWLREVVRLYEQGFAAHVTLTSPLHLLKELFTVRGAGTLIRPGSCIERFDSYEAIDQQRLQRLLEASFGRALKPGFFSRKIRGLYLETNYRAAAILEASTPAPLLTKFAVEPVAQGEGMGHDLWRCILRDERKIYWRARPQNPIVSWYAGLCDGLARQRQWSVFWKGLEPAEIPLALERASSIPEDFSEHGMSSS